MMSDHPFQHTFTILHEVHFLRCTLLVEDAWVSVSTLIYPNSFLSGGGQDSVQANPVHQRPTLIDVFMDLALSTGHSLVRKSAIVKLFPQSWDHKIVKNLLYMYGETFTIPFIGAKGPSPTPEKQCPTINLLH